MLLSEKMIKEGRFGRVLGAAALAAGAAFGHGGPDYRSTAQDFYNTAERAPGMCDISVDADGLETRTGECGDVHSTNDIHRIAHLFNSCPSDLGFVTVVKSKKTADGSTVLRFSDKTGLVIDANHNITIFNTNGTVRHEYFGDKADAIVAQAQHYIDVANHK